MSLEQKTAVATAAHGIAFFVGLMLAFATPFGVLFFGPLVVAQLGLFDAWLAFGRGRWHERLAVWGTVMFLLSVPLLFAPLLAASLHAAGLALFRRKVAGLYFFIGDPQAMAHRRLQFSLMHLMAVTLAVAVVFAVARFLRTLEDAPFGSDVLFGVALFLAVEGGLLLSHLTALWGVLGTERPRLGLCGAVLVAGVLGGVLAFAVGEGGEAYLYLPLTSAAQQAIFGGSLLAIRADGYRLFLHPPKSRREPAGASELEEAPSPDDIQFLTDATEPAQRDTPADPGSRRG